jgi:hypothetical protein
MYLFFQSKKIKPLSRNKGRNIIFSKKTLASAIMATSMGKGDINLHVKDFVLFLHLSLLLLALPHGCSVGHLVAFTPGVHKFLFPSTPHVLSDNIAREHSCYS